MSNDLVIRKAQASDLPFLLAIYNDEVANGTATLDITPQTIQERKTWFDAHAGGRYALFAADSGGEVVGYASLSRYRDKEAYDATVELSVYVARAHRGKGIGKALMTHILAYARERTDIRTVVSVITAGNEASENLHASFGFAFCSEIPDVAVKFGKSLAIRHYVLSVHN